MEHSNQNNEEWVDVIPPKEYEQFLNALKTDHLSIIKSIHHLYPDNLNSSLDNDQTFPIHIASKYGSFKTIDYLLTHFPSQLNQADVFGQTPVFLAASSGYVNIVQYLVEKNAILDRGVRNPSNGRQGITALIIAMLNSHHQVVDVLLKAGVSLLKETTTPAFYDIALKWGIEQKQLALVEHLLQQLLFSVMSSKRMVYFMSIAIQKSSLDVIKLFALRNPPLLCLPDDYGKTPILWAARRGDVDIIKYLIDKQVDVDLFVDNPNHPDYKKPLYLLAHEAKHYAAASLIIDTVRSKYDNPETIFEFIVDAETALEYIKLSEENAQLILKNQRLLKLIENTGANITPKSVGYYRIAGARRPSFFLNIDRQTGQVEEFVPYAFLGKGTNHVVRAFVNLKNGKPVAIKKPIPEWFLGEELKNEQLAANSELEFTKEASKIKNTELGVYSFYSRSRNEFTLRTVIPYAGPCTVNEALKKIRTPSELANIIWLMAHELILLHEKGIIHGDVKETNVVMSIENEITWIDFEYSYYLTDKFATCDPTGSYWAPERRKYVNAPVPDTSQDVYSFASMLASIQKKYLCKEKCAQFPSIVAFITQGMEEQPEKRPTLQSFCETLSDEIKHRNTPQICHPREGKGSSPT